MSEIAPVEVGVPAVVQELHLLNRIDYEDAYTVSTALQRPAEQWVRSFIEDAPRWFQLPWVAMGKAVLGAHFGPLGATPGYVLGWRILHHGSELCVVGLDSVAGLRARLIAVAPAGRVVIATQIQLDTTYARMWWPAIRRGHRLFAPYLLRRAASRCSAGHAGNLT